MFAGEQKTRQGRKYVEAHPVAQGDMPALPELGDIALQIGLGEVFRQFDPEQLPDSDSNVSITTEIEIEPEPIGIKQCPQPGSRALLRRLSRPSRRRPSSLPCGNAWYGFAALSEKKELNHSIQLE